GNGIGVTGSGSGTLTLSGSLAAINSFVNAGSVRYQTAADSTASQTLAITINDGGNTGTGGPLSASSNVTLNVTAVNDAPSITAPGSLLVTENVATALTGISFSDVDAGTGTVTVTLSVGAGSLSAAGGNGVNVTGTGSGTLTLSGSLAAINSFVNAGSVRFQTATNSTASQTLTVSIDDGGNTGTGGPLTASTSVALNVTGVNVAPSINAPGSLTVTEDVATALTGISFSDADAGTGIVTVTLSVGAGSLSATGGNGIGVTGSGSGTLTLSGSLSDINSFVNAGSVRYQTAADSTASQTLAITINDGGNTGTGGPLSASSSVTLNVTAVNDAPSINAPGSLTVTEDVATALTGISFADVDAGTGTVTVTLSVGAGSLTAAGGNGVNVTGSGSGTLTLSGSLAAINSFVNAGSVRFQTAANSTASQTLAITINDGGNTGTGGPLSASSSVTLNVTAVNDAPSITAPGSLTVTENVATALTGISFADVDAGTGTVTVTLSVGAGSLSATGGNGIGVTGSGSGTLTLSGSLAAINSFVNAGSVRFQTAANSTASQTLAITINDGGNSGTGGPLTASSSVTLNVTAVNDAPSITAPTTITVTEDVAAVLTGISFSDVDAGTGTVTVTLSVGAGSLTATGGNGVGVTGSGSGTLTLSGSLAAINSFVNAGSVRFQTAANSTAGQTLTITINDGGNSGTGGPLTASSSVTINVTPVNDAPVATGVAIPLIQGQVGQPLNVTLPAGLFSDADANDTLTLSVRDLPAGLSFDAATRTISGSPLTAGTGIAITVIATDQAGLTAEVTAQVQIAAEPVTVPVSPPPPPPPAPAPTTTTPTVSVTPTVTTSLPTTT
ncbi:MULTISPECIES: putative Ig domain-containing protein, partial [unclassified Azospirillum]|uniref:beta strand repeat-containing protein n=1 Tax=unclassified Azospirillum TaxID=2630922 RepID=UPI00190EDDC6